jgi:hypothetical protein
MASTYLTRTFGTAGNRKTWTWSSWIKISTLDIEHNILMGGNTSYNDAYIRITGGNQLRFLMPDGTTTVGTLNTTQVLRDTSAWYHIVCVYDSSNATSSERMRIYINGNRITDFSTELYPSQNQDSFNINNASPHYIGAKHDATTFFDGSMSHVHFIDGTAYDATAFGEYDANGVWKIKTSPSVTYGTNGFFILKDGNSVTDQSGNSNNFTVAGGTLTKTEDSPSNVFATLNALHKGSGVSLSNGNNTYTAPSGSYASVLSTLGFSQGKYYCEYKWVSGSANSHVGIAYGNINLNTYLGAVGYAYYADGTKWNNNSSSSYGNSYANGDIIGVAVDLDNGAIWFSKNGTWQNSATSTEIENGTTTNAAFTGLSGEFFFGVGMGNSNEVANYNFGNGYFGTTAVASAGTNASGIGIFEYDVPTGYTALSTKGLNL